MTSLSFNFFKTPESLRRGTLALSVNDRQKILQTPGCLFYTSRGSVPHLTPDNFQRLPCEAVHISLEHFLDSMPPPLLGFPHGIHKYLELENYIVYADVRDPDATTSAPTNTKHYVSAMTNSGARQVTVNLYSQMINTLSPDICAGLADVLVENDPTVKRVQKSVERTTRWLDEFLELKKSTTNVFGVLVGSQFVEERRKSAKEIASRNVQGFVMHGSKLGRTIKERMDLLKTSIECLPEEKPRLVYGLGSPVDVLIGISLGIDLFDTSYAFQMTTKGHALTFVFETHLNLKSQTPNTSTINLWEESNANNFGPLMAECNCYSCQSHSRGYIHHLLKTHEMLANVLLMIHNLHQYTQFFENIRQSIANGNFHSCSRYFMERYGFAYAN
ncbi:uncharacterized protein VTP21DRAFT_10418 [Calcarisporiella thermophila]|uniref:uncharacterized protein n=1 Tax=Calcarisporiella thermophila TaxID=911321 RepID=UPI003743FBFA